MGVHKRIHIQRICQLPEVIVVILIIVILFFIFILIIVTLREAILLLLLILPSQVKKRWIAAKGKAPTNDDAERIYIKVSKTLTLLPSSFIISAIPLWPS